MIFFDIETDGLLDDVSKLYCIVAYDDETNIIHIGSDHPDLLEHGMQKHGMLKEGVFSYETIEETLRRLAVPSAVLCGHNIVGYDLPALGKLYGFVTEAEVVDTLILSRLFFPDREGHSLAYYGELLGSSKIDYHDWSRLTLRMVEYCVQDVRLTCKVYQHLTSNEVGWNWAKSVSLEHSVAKVQVIQEQRGVYLDQELAYRVAEEIIASLNDIDKQLFEQLPYRVVQGTEVGKPFKKDGTLSVRVLKVFEDDPSVVGGPFTKVSFERFNLNSHDQIKDFLLSCGWKPDTWNYKKENGRVVNDRRTGLPVKTTPKITESSLSTVDNNVGQLLGSRSVLRHRLGMVFNIKTTGELSGWLNTVRPDGTLVAGAITQATNTGRAKQFNIVNVPGADNPFYGKELRSMITAPEGYKMVGIDAAGLEARIQAHYVYPYTGGAELAHELLEGDIHKANASIFFNVPVEEVTKEQRTHSKPIYYGLMYGAQPAKVAEIMDCNLAKGTQTFNKFWASYRCLDEFKNILTGVWEDRKKESKGGYGYLKGLDGRKLYARSKHSLVNLMFQSAGSIVVKKALTLIHERIKEHGLDAYQCIFYHDELEYICHPGDVEQLCSIAEKAFEDAGKYFNLNVPIEGEAKVGYNWADVH